jgi:hypothetical protein
MFFLPHRLDNVGLWYRNLKTCLKELNDIVEKLDEEKRKTLFNEITLNLFAERTRTRKGRSSTHWEIWEPDEISVHPHSGMYTLFFYLSLGMFALGIFTRRKNSSE